MQLGVWLLSDVSYSDECQTKKYFQYAENMFPLFFAILKFCNTKHLFDGEVVRFLRVLSYCRFVKMLYFFLFHSIPFDFI